MLLQWSAMNKRAVNCLSNFVVCFMIWRSAVKRVTCMHTTCRVRWRRACDRPLVLTPWMRLAARADAVHATGRVPYRRACVRPSVLAPCRRLAFDRPLSKRQVAVLTPWMRHTGRAGAVHATCRACWHRACDLQSVSSMELGTKFESPIGLPGSENVIYTSNC